MNPLLIEALKNGAQGASNAIADQVSAPVDNVMGKFSMVGIRPQQPVLGSSGFMQQIGAKAPATGMSADIGKLIGGQIMGMAMGQKPNFMNGLLGLAGGYAVNKLMEAKPWEKWGIGKNE